MLEWSQNLCVTTDKLDWSKQHVIYYDVVMMLAWAMFVNFNGFAVRIRSFIRLMFDGFRKAKLKSIKQGLESIKVATDQDYSTIQLTI